MGERRSGGELAQDDEQCGDADQGLDQSRTKRPPAGDQGQEEGGHQGAVLQHAAVGHQSGEGDQGGQEFRPQGMPRGGLGGAGRGGPRPGSGASALSEAGGAGPAVTRRPL